MPIGAFRKVHPYAIVAHNQMQLPVEVAHIDAHLRSEGVTVDICERLLNNAKKTALHFKGRVVRNIRDAGADAQPRPSAKSQGIALCSVAKAVIIELWRMQEIG